MNTETTTPEELAEGHTGLRGNFARHVDVVDGDHWRWTASLGTGGAPKGRDGKQTVEVHRRLYELVIGPIPADEVAIRCEDRLCVNPFHVKLGTLADTHTERVQATCFRGHDTSTPDTRVGGTMSGACLKCTAARGRIHRKRLKERALSGR